MEIIDFRFRPNTQATIDGFTKSTMFKGMFAKMDLTRLYAQSVPDIVHMIRKEGYVKAVITGRDCSGTYDAPSNNPGVKAFVREFPDMFVGFMGVDPNRGMDAVYELERDIREDGMHGACIDPYLAKMFVNDARYYPVYGKCCELNIPVIVSTGPGTLVPGAIMEHAAPRYIDVVARDFPQLRIVISHGGYPWVEEAIMVAERNENVYMELSEYERHPGAESYIKAAAGLIGDKILFASAHPGADFRDAVAMYKGFGLPDAVLERIMAKNALKVLGL